MYDCFLRYVHVLHASKALSRCYEVSSSLFSTQCMYSINSFGKSELKAGASLHMINGLSNQDSNVRTVLYKEPRNQ